MCCTTYSTNVSPCCFLLCQMRQQATAGGQRPSLPNGPSPESSKHHASLPRTSPMNHTAIRPPCVTQPTANGSCSSPSSGLLGRLDRSSPGKGHNLALGGGGTSNGNVPYPQQNSLPLNNCTAASLPSTSSTTNSPSHAEETWRSQHCNTTTQVGFIQRTRRGQDEPCRKISCFYKLMITSWNNTKNVN